MRQALRDGALGRPRRMRWRGRQEGGSGWGTHVNPWLIHVNVWQKPLQYCKVISLQLININGKRKRVSMKNWLLEIEWSCSVFKGWWCFPVFPFEDLIKIPHGFTHCAVSVLRCWKQGTSSWGNDFICSASMSFWTLCCSELWVRLTHLRKCKENWLSGSIPCDGH